MIDAIKEMKQHIAMLSTPDLEEIEEWFDDAWIAEGWSVRSINISSAFCQKQNEIVHTVCAIVEK